MHPISTPRQAVDLLDAAVSADPRNARDIAKAAGIASSQPIRWRHNPGAATLASFLAIAEEVGLRVVIEDTRGVVQPPEPQKRRRVTWRRPANHSCQ